jgi:hypothetical protein
MENRKAKLILSGDWYEWEGEDIMKGCRRVNMVEIVCAHVCKGKMKPVETIAGMGAEG